ncbi:MAG: MBL fold metallo-hydrolase [Myxococcaceae bacterium]|nr:MBL fold metallo-hydrolase [Myxococcaceae bacterium]
MLRWTWPLLLCACASIPLPPAGGVRPPPKAAREVEVCAVVGGEDHRRRWLGVAELSFSEWVTTTISIVVRHPSGVLVIDPAFGRALPVDLRAAPLWSKPILGDLSSKRPIGDLLREVGIAPAEVKFAALSHAHWDHATGLADLPLSVAWLSRTEAEWWPTLEGQFVHGVMPAHLRRAASRLTPFDFDGPPVLGFAASHDFFGDGSVVAVPLPGHTPGSTGYLLAGQGGKRWLYIGDTTWTFRGVEKPAHKNPLLGATVDLDPEQLGVTIGLLHALLLEHPEVQIVPGHDLQDFMPRCEKVFASGPAAAP